MSTLLTIVFGAACSAAGIAVVEMRRERAGHPNFTAAPGGKRVDQARRDQVQALIDDTTLLLAHMRFRNWLIVFAFAVLTAVNVIGLRANQDLAASTNKALCTFRHDLELRATGGRDFLKGHPNGAFGLTKAQILQSLVNQEKTLTSLESLHCAQ